LIPLRRQLPDNVVNHRTGFFGFEMPNEQPIAFSKCAALNRTLDQVVVNFKKTFCGEP
jgi:hypothetical protein